MASGITVSPGNGLELAFRVGRSEAAQSLLHPVTASFETPLPLAHLGGGVGGGIPENVCVCCPASTVKWVEQISRIVCAGALKTVSQEEGFLEDRK